MDEPVVQFENVSKVFRRGQLHDSLRDTLGTVFAWLRGRSRRASAAEAFYALQDVGFSVRPGEALGVIGPNGAGKSTVLKLLAGILRADAGRVRVSGRIGALIEVSAGMHGDLTGRENIYLSGAIMGMGRREVDNKLDAIVAFSGLRDFLDTPVKRYSTGMTARLGFSVAAHVDPNVLLVDEVLSVGDIAFRQRCEARMHELVRNGTALVFVTHNLEQMRAICHRTVVLDKGRVAFAGEPAEAVEHYLKATMNAAGDLSYRDCPQDSGAVAEVLGLRYLNAAENEVGVLGPEDPVTIEMTFRCRERIRRLAVETTIRSLTGATWVNFNSARQGRWYSTRIGTGRVRVRLQSLPLAGGSYLARVRLWDADACRLVSETPMCFPLQVDDGGRTTGLLAIANCWSEVVDEVGNQEASEASFARGSAKGRLQATGGIV